MCSSCYDELEFLPFVPNRKYNDTKIYCAGVYSKNLQKIIRGIKYHNQRDLAFFIAKFMYQYWTKLENSGEYIIIPVPIYEKRKKKRKYNHMDLVADELSKLTGYEVAYDIIKRVKDTKPQYKLKKSQRIMNLDKAFCVNPCKDIHGKKLLLIDDICTTGATFEEMIRAFNNAGFCDITCFAATTPFD